jgi:hypothetical protein
MAPNHPSELTPSIEMKSSNRGGTEAGKVFTAMRRKIEEVYPDDDAEAWQWRGEDFVTHDIERPTHTFKGWFKKQYVSSDPFTQQLVRRMFTMWKEMEQEGFIANDLQLFEQQKALFAWIALESATGTRREIANLLVRSPYGSGKSLLGGLVTRAFRETQEEMMQEGTDKTRIPTGALLGLRKEHMLQNALGEQYAVLQPPYTMERRDVLTYWHNLTTLFGNDFSEHFPKPHGTAHPFYALFSPSEDMDVRSAAERIEEYRRTLPETCNAGWAKIAKAKRTAILSTLEDLLEGRIVLIPDIYNVPRPERAMPRENADSLQGARYRGDSAHALHETDDYRVKATHKHLALDPTTYTKEPDETNPAQFCIAYGSMLFRPPELLRADIREEIMRRCRFLCLDEAGKYTPATVGSTAEELTGQWPYILGFTGRDAGIEGWTKRSPVLSVRQMIRSRLMKPIAFQGIGDARSPTAPGSEEAWKVYRSAMFANVRTAETLNLPQPHELDTVVIAPARHVREYAHRIAEEHKKKKIPLKIWCFDPAARDSRWSIIVNGFEAPKKEGDPKRILVAPSSQIAEALHLHAQNYDVLANVNTYAMDQIRGRLGHVRNTEKTSAEQEKARTYFRVQWLEGALGEAYIREVAAMMGYTIEPEDATWRPLQCMIDGQIFEKDKKRRGLSDAEPIPDTRAVARRKRRYQRGKATYTPLRSTSAFVIAEERKRVCHPTKTPAVSQPQKTFSARKDGVCIKLSMDSDGFPLDLESLARDFSVQAYHSSLVITIQRAHEAGTRGTALARVVLKELLRLQDVRNRRVVVGDTQNGSDGRAATPTTIRPHSWR